ncbi:hypothetical protein BH24ACT5_BH24ACT5_13980 [soil metagenome]
MLVNSPAVALGDVGHRRLVGAQRPAVPEAPSPVYAVRGALFFASSNDLVYQFDYAHDPQNVIIDLSEAQIYDSSTVAALDAIALKYHNKDKHVEIVGMNEASAKWHELSGSLGAAH